LDDWELDIFRSAETQERRGTLMHFTSTPPPAPQDPCCEKDTENSKEATQEAGLHSARSKTVWRGLPRNWVPSPNGLATQVCNNAVLADLIGYRPSRDPLYTEAPARRCLQLAGWTGPLPERHRASCTDDVEVLLQSALRASPPDPFTGCFQWPADPRPATTMGNAPRPCCWSTEPAGHATKPRQAWGQGTETKTREALAIASSPDTRASRVYQPSIATQKVPPVRSAREHRTPRHLGGVPYMTLPAARRGTALALLHPGKGPDERRSAAMIDVERVPVL
jgi:hypothetical protein